MRNLSCGVLMLGLVLPWSGATAQEHDHAGGAEVLGRVEFPVTCSADAQAGFERAMALLHSFWWDEARRAFAAVAATDPECAMAHWGSAMVARGNWFAGAPPPAAVAAGLAAAERGLEIGAGTPRERGYLDAVATLFRGAAEGDYRAAALAYEEAMRALHEAHPDDAEAAMFYAMSVTANATPTDKTFERQRRAGALLESLFARRPDHPGLAHYIIHTYDSPPIAHMGVEAARRYGTIAPSVPHAQHMPSHIFTRLGMWDESIEANSASAEAARAYEEAEGMASVSFDRAHAWDYLAYAYLQQGRDAAAADLADQVWASTAVASIATDYAFAAMPARYALERGRWDEARALTVRPSPGFAAGEAITHFARGVGAARAGDLASAGESMSELTAIRDRLRERGDAYWANAVEVQRLAVSAWMAHRQGDAARAVELIREAAELEERIDKHPVTPGPILPTRELEGDMLMELGRPVEALAAYQSALRLEPRRSRSLYGAARAARAVGDDATARARFAELVEVMEPADTERPELQEARAYLDG